jgi:hypothetical protein
VGGSPRLAGRLTPCSGRRFAVVQCRPGMNREKKHRAAALCVFDCAGLTTQLLKYLSSTTASVARRRTLSGTRGWRLIHVGSCAASEWG